MKREYHPIVFYVALIVGAFIVGVLIFNGLILPRLVGRRDVTIVPDIVDMSLKHAEERCRESGLKLVVIGRRNSDEAPVDYILEQDPHPEGGLKEGRAIRVTVSSGRRMESVPDLRNKSLRQAQLLLDNAGLVKGRIVRIFTHGEARNTILSASPAAGTVVPHGSRVDLLMNVGGRPRNFLMPDLVGMDLPFVKERLEGLGFSISRVISRRAEGKFPNTILSQTPEAGCLIKEGGTIELVVATVE